MPFDRLLLAGRGRAGARARDAAPRAPSRLGPLANLDFRRLWIVGVIVFAMRWLEMIVVGVFVYQHTGSAFDVALMTMLRMLPMALFGAVIGAMVERLQRRTALIVVVASMAATSICLMILAFLGELAIWHIAIASFCGGVASAADNPVRRVMIGDVVGSERMSTAMSIDVGANNASRMLGPTIGGLLLASSGIAGAYTLCSLCYAAALIAALRVRHRDTIASAGGGAVLTRVVEGFLIARRDSKLIAILVITVIYNVFGWPFTSMIPVIGQDNLHLGARGIGMLASMDGVGSFCGAIAIALFIRPKNYARIYIGGVVAYLLLLIVFAIAPNVWLAGATLVFTGVANASFSVMQATLIYLAAPAEMRSRMYGVLSVCIGSSPIGFLYLGTLADLLGAPAATILTGILGLAVLILTRRWWRGLATA